MEPANKTPTSLRNCVIVRLLSHMLSQFTLSAAAPASYQDLKQGHNVVKRTSGAAGASGQALCTRNAGLEGGTQSGHTSMTRLLLLNLIHVLIVPACSPGAVLIQALNGHSQQTQVQLCHCSVCPKAKLIGKVLIPQTMAQVVHANISQSALKQPTGSKTACAIPEHHIALSQAPYNFACGMQSSSSADSITT